MYALLVEVGLSFRMVIQVIPIIPIIQIIPIIKIIHVCLSAQRKIASNATTVVKIFV